MAASDPARHAANSAISHIGPYVPAWLCLGVSYGAANAAHWAWSTSPGPAQLAAGAAAGLTWLTWKLAPKTATLWRGHTTATTGVCTAGIATATAFDPTAPGALSAWAIIGSTMALSWNIRRIVTPGSQNPDGTAVARPDDLAGVVKALRDAKLGPAQVEGGRVSVQVHAPDGVDAIQQSTKQIAARLGVGPTAVRVLADPDDASRAELVIVPHDHLRNPQPWPGLSNLGGSIAAPVVVGAYEDGEPARMWFPGDPRAGRNATHYGVFGMNGSGKSTGAEGAWLEILSRADAELWLADPVKGKQTCGPYAGHAKIAITPADCRAMIRQLKRDIAERADLFGELGYKEWVPELYTKHGIPFRVVWFEECASLFREEIGDDITGLLETARSLGISIEISLQRPSATTMPSDAKEQTGGAWVFGVKGSSTARMALPDEVREAGAAPEAWANRRPGYCYLIGPGIPEDRFAMPLRTWLIPPEQRDQALAAIADALGMAFSNEDQNEPRSLSIAQAKTHGVINANEVALPVNHEPDLEDVDPDEPIDVPAAPSMSFAEPPAFRMPRQQAAALLDAALVQMHDAGVDTFRPHDLKPVRDATGHSRTWVTGELKRHLEAGRIEDVDGKGTYRIVRRKQPALV